MLMNSKINQNMVLSAIFFVIPIVVIICCFSSGISGNDFWWHIKVGEYIIETGEVPSTDIFSWYGMELGIDWTAHEWLSDVIYFLIFNTFGQLGMFVFSVGSAIALYFCLWMSAKRYITNNFLFSGLFLALFGVLSSMFFYGRPHVFSYFLLFFELKILYDFVDNQESKKIYTIPLIAILWSNLHGGSSNLTYILCLIFIFCGLCNFSVGRIEAKRLKNCSIIKLIVVTALSVIGIMINPIGLKVIAYPYINLSDNLSMTLISEWASPDAKIIGNLILYFLPIIVMTIGIISEKTSIRLLDIALMLAFLFLFFRSARFIMLWYIVAVFYAFRYMPQIKVKKIKKSSENIALGGLFFLLLVFMVFGVYKTSETYNEGKLISTVVDDTAIEAIKQDAPARIFNDYNLGEALIYNDINVFFDARADLFVQENIMADGVSLMFLEQANKEAGTKYVDVDGLLKKYNFDAVAILKVRALYSYILSHPERFSLVYEDSTMAYYRIVR